MSDLAQRIKAATTGCKLSIGSVSVRKKITVGQQLQIAALFSADTQSVDGGRKIINPKLEPVANVFRVLREIRAAWVAYTIPYEPGVRLIRTDRVAWITDLVNKAKTDLREASEALHARWGEVVADAQARLGSLFVAEDYEVDVRDMVSLDIAFPAIEPDNRVAQLAPEVFEAERVRIAAKMQEVAVAQEQAMQAELLAMVSSLQTRLVESESEDGKKRYVRQAAIDEVVSFAERFKATAITSDAQLDEIVNRARELASGVDMAAVRKDGDARSALSAQFGALKENLEKYVEVKKDRKFEL